MAAVLLGMARLNAFDADSQSEPADGEQHVITLEHLDS